MYQLLPLINGYCRGSCAGVHNIVFVIENNYARKSLESLQVYFDNNYYSCINDHESSDNIFIRLPLSKNVIVFFFLPTILQYYAIRPLGSISVYK